MQEVYKLIQALECKYSSEQMHAINAGSSAFCNNFNDKEFLLCHKAKYIQAQLSHLPFYNKMINLQ